MNSGKIGPGFLKQVKTAFTVRHDGSLDMAIADLDGDGRYDAITGQGESRRRGDFRNRFYRGHGPKDRKAVCDGLNLSMTTTTKNGRRLQMEPIGALNVVSAGRLERSLVDNIGI